MCGFAGIVELGGRDVGPKDQRHLAAMGRAIAYRGPDDDAILRSGPFGVAFRRLSIVDVEGGQQPFVADDGDLVVVANGEIYNHAALRKTLRGKPRFASDSDCEVILHLYRERGLALLDELVGMYAFAIWDRKKKRVVLARDRFGIKPLFYATPEGPLGRLLFGSEVKAVLAHPACPRAFDWDAALADPWLAEEPASSWADPPSYFRGVEHLPAGHVVEIDLRKGTVARRRYWAPPIGAKGAAADRARADAQWIEGYRERLAEAVDLCLMSDVEVGVFLSGGVDSAIVSALAARRGPLHTFTVLGASTLGNGDAAAAHALAQQLDVPNHQVVFDWRRERFTPEHWLQLLWLCETPYAGPEQLYKFHLHRYAKEARPELKVILTGQGSDEWNGGYSTLFSSKPGPGWAGFVDATARMLDAGLVRAGAPLLGPWQARFQTPVFTEGFLRARAAGAPPADPYASYLWSKFRDLQVYNLWHEDRTAAGNGIESRVPFLDHRLVEWVLRVPEARHDALLWDKKILREAVKPLLPRGFAKREKVPFFHGRDVRDTHRMMMGILGAKRGALLEEAFGSFGGAAEVLAPHALRGILDEAAQDPEANDATMVLRLTNMALLDRLARQQDVDGAPSERIPTLRAEPIEDWEAAAPGLAVRFAAHAPVGPKSVLAFQDGVSMVRTDTASSAREWTVVIGDRMAFELDPAEVGPWIEVLRLIDGETPLAKLLARANVHEADIRKHVEEALAFDVIRIVGSGP